DHPLLAHLHRAEVGKLLLLEGFEVDAPTRGSGGEIDIAAVARGNNRPLREIGPVGDLHQASARSIFVEKLRKAGPVRDEDQPLHRAVIGRDEEEWMMMDRR